MYVGYFWIVYDQLFKVGVEFDSAEAAKSKDKIYYPQDVEEAWDICRVENSLPKKPWDHYDHGEVFFDLTKHKFRAQSSAKVILTPAIQKKIIKKFGLPRYVIFESPSVKVDTSNDF